MTSFLLVFVLSVIVILVPYQIQRSQALFSDDLIKISDSDSNTTTSQIMEGFSLYENSIYKISIQYPSDWDKQEIFNNDYTTIDIF
jgi:hypothetical protein